jgi:hypothetical protein
MINIFFTGKYNPQFGTDHDTEGYKELGDVAAYPRGGKFANQPFLIDGSILDGVKNEKKGKEAFKNYLMQAVKDDLGKLLSSDEKTNITVNIALLELDLYETNAAQSIFLPYSVQYRAICDIEFGIIEK